MFKSMRSMKIVLTGLLACSIALPTAFAQSAQNQQKPAAPAGDNPAASIPNRNQPPRIAKRAAAIYEAVWGIEDPNVKAVESGIILRFNYRVLDPEKAAPLNDKKVDPVLICPEKGIKLVIPTMEKVGQLRQTATPEAGKSYWMAFSNSGRLLKPGDRVDVVIGNFRAQGLIIQ